MNPWTYLLFGGMFGAISTVLITLGLNELKRRDEVYSLSAPSSMEVEFDPVEGNTVVRFHNASPHAIVNVEVYPVAYTIEGSPPKITNRIQPAGNMRLVERIPPNDTLTEYANRFTRMYEGDESALQKLNFMALVIVYRREIDNKRFVAIEPFVLAPGEGYRDMGSLYSSNHWAQSGSPGPFLSVVKEIVETEKIFFRGN